MGTALPIGSAAGRVRSCLALVLLLSVTACGAVEREQPLETVIAAAEGGDRQAVRELISRFNHPDPKVAQKAWETVAGIGEGAEEELIAALGSKDRAIVEHAAGALGGRTSKKAVEPLMEVFKRPQTPRYVVVWALGEIGDPRAIPTLIEALGADDQEVCKYATRSLIKLGPVAMEALLAALESESPVRRHYAVRALGEIRDPRAVVPLLGLEGRVEREVVFWALGRLGDPRGFDVVAGAVEDRDWRIRLSAIQALRDLGDERAVPILEEALRDEEWMIREWAARGLESITGQRFRYRDQHGEEVYPYALYR